MHVSQLDITETSDISSLLPVNHMTFRKKTIVEGHGRNQLPLGEGGYTLTIVMCTIACAKRKHYSAVTIYVDTHICVHVYMCIYI